MGKCLFRVSIIIIYLTIGSLREKENKLEIKKVEYQIMTSEDEVVRKAKQHFELMRIDNLDKIMVNKNKIENLKKFVAKKYD